MKYELIEVRSGGQTGADIAGVMAAKVCGIPTSGWLPKGWKTQDGPKPQYAKLFNMQEHYAAAYPPRTYANVRDSDATIRFAANFDSAGERCTLKAIKEYGKPYIDVSPNDHKEETAHVVAKWIVANDLHKINVAGNAKSTSATIGFFTFNYLIKVFEELGYSTIEEMKEFHKYVVLRLSSPGESPGSP